MTAFDTDVLSLVFTGNTATVQRLASVPMAVRGVPIVVAGEIVRGWLNVIRQAEAGKGRLTLDRAYLSFERSLRELGSFRLLSYTAQAEALFQQ